MISGNYSECTCIFSFSTECYIFLMQDIQPPNRKVLIHLKEIVKDQLRIGLRAYCEDKGR